MHSPVALVLLLTGLISCVQCTTTFSVPPGAGPEGDYSDDPIYTVGEQKVFQWDSDLDKMDLLVWQAYPPAAANENNFIKIMQDASNTNNFSWTISLDGFSINLPEGDDAVFFVALFRSGANTWDASSHYFNITLPVTSSTSASAEATTAEATTTKPTTAVATTAEATTAEATTASSVSPGPTNVIATAESSATPSITTDPNDDSNSGQSTGAIAGIAVGATIGGLLALSALAFLFWRHYRKGRGRGEHNPGQIAPEETKSELAGGQWNQAPPQQLSPPVYGQPSFAPLAGEVYEVA